MTEKIWYHSTILSRRKNCSATGQFSTGSTKNYKQCCTTSIFDLVVQYIYIYIQNVGETLPLKSANLD